MEDFCLYVNRQKDGSWRSLKWGEKNTFKGRKKYKDNLKYYIEDSFI